MFKASSIELLEIFWEEITALQSKRKSQNNSHQQQIIGVQALAPNKSMRLDIDKSVQYYCQSTGCVYRRNSGRSLVMEVVVACQTEAQELEVPRPTNPPLKCRRINSPDVLDDLQTHQTDPDVLVLKDSALSSQKWREQITASRATSYVKST